LEEFIECIELRDKKDRQLCDVCKKKFAFHRRKNAISFASSNPLQPPTLSNNTSVGTAVVRNVLPALPSYSSSSSSNSCLDFTTTVLPARLSPSNTGFNDSIPATTYTLNGMPPPVVLSPLHKFPNIYDPEAFQNSQQSIEKETDVSLEDSDWFSGFLDNANNVDEEDVDVAVDDICHYNLMDR
jgi:hypothetical protein